MRGLAPGGDFPHYSQQQLPHSSVATSYSSSRTASKGSKSFRQQKDKQDRRKDKESSSGEAASPDVAGAVSSSPGDKDSSEIKDPFSEDSCREQHDSPTDPSISSSSSPVEKDPVLSEEKGVSS